MSKREKIIAPAIASEIEQRTKKRNRESCKK
jgi:hypothetical protein